MHRITHIGHFSTQASKERIDEKASDLIKISKWSQEYITNLGGDKLMFLKHPVYIYIMPFNE